MGLDLLNGRYCRYKHLASWSDRPEFSGPVVLETGERLEEKCLDQLHEYSLLIRNGYGILGAKCAIRPRTVGLMLPNGERTK